jgi:predicted enzyme related to lactoylglutathione lyase
VAGVATRLWSVVIDANDVAALATWWADALGWPATQVEAGEWVVQPEGNAETAAVPNLVFGTVPERHTAKNRVHLDLASESESHQDALVERLVANGATRIDIGQHDVPWIVLADPEGNEFCVLEPRARYLGKGPLASIVVDAHDPAAEARFWAAASGWPIGFEREQLASLHNPNGRPPDLDFVPVPDRKVVKDRVHLDVAPYAGDDRDVEVERLVELGATRADVGQGPDVTWVVLADPDGHELCVLRPR